ncbi:YceI family protein [Psychroserpens sp. MEBiC05023]
MKKIVIILIGLMSMNVTAQKYFTKTGTTEFKASVEAFEPVEAKNKSTTVILNIENGQIAGLLFVKAFHFEIALMQEHFNENYMDSDKYPKATFRGQLEEFDLNNLSNESQEFKLKGTLIVRGKEKKIDAIALLKKEGDKILFTSAFNVKPQEFNIKIPSIVREKIASSINLTLNYELVKKN